MLSYPSERKHTKAEALVKGRIALPDPPQEPFGESVGGAEQIIEAAHRDVLRADALESRHDLEHLGGAAMEHDLATERIAIGDGRTVLLRQRHQRGGPGGIERGTNLTAHARFLLRGDPRQHG